MTEAEWLASDDPAAMLPLINGGRMLSDKGRPVTFLPRASPRKLRLFACACCELMRPGWYDAAGLDEALAACRAYADGERQDLPERYCGRAYYAAAPDAHLAARSAVDELCRSFPGLSPSAAALLRCLWGNPWRPVLQCEGCPGGWQNCLRCPKRLIAHWLSWNDGTVRRLAEAIYAERAFGVAPWEGRCQFCGRDIGAGHEQGCPYWNGYGSNRLSILADALEEAGCAEPDLLAHLRDIGPHARGCWVLDLLLGKS